MDESNVGAKPDPKDLDVFLRYWFAEHGQEPPKAP